MRTGVSIPFPYIASGDNELTSGEFLAELRNHKVASCELRNVIAGENPQKVLDAARRLWSFGLNITVHGVVTSVETAIHDLLDPVDLVCREMKQRELIIVVHSPVSDVVKLTEMLRSISDEIIRRGYSVRIALENNRLMPADSEDPDGDSAKLVEDAVCTCGRDNIGICFDMGHFYFHAIKHLGNKDAMPDKEFLSHVIHTHIHATHGLKTHFPLEDRFELPLEKYISALGIEYEGLYNIEISPLRYGEFIDGCSGVMESVERLQNTVNYRNMLCEWIRENYTGRFLSAAELCDEDGKENNFAMLNSSAYLFRTEDITFGVDVETHDESEYCDVSSHLGELAEKLSFMLITHGHVDHFEAQSVGMMRGHGMKWIIPDFLTDMAHWLGLSDDEITVIHDRETVKLGGVEITAFASAHYRPITHDGLDEYGYFISGSGLPDILIVGDIRDYSTETLPGKEFAGRCDVLFVHMWLGDGKGRDVDYAPYDVQLADFIDAYSPKNVIFGHLYKTGREDDAMWRSEHALHIADILKSRGNQAAILIPKFGEKFKL